MVTVVVVICAMVGECGLTSEGGGFPDRAPKLPCMSENKISLLSHPPLSRNIIFSERSLGRAPPRRNLKSGIGISSKICVDVGLENILPYRSLIE